MSGEGPEASLRRGSEILGHTGSVDKEYRVKLYDFRRPDKFSMEQIWTVCNIHKSFSSLMTTSLSATLRQDWRAELESVDQMTFDEFMSPLPTPNIFVVSDMDPLKGKAIYQLDPVEGRVMLDRLFGGVGEIDPTVRRELSAMEWSVLAGIFLKILGNIREAWSQLIDLRPALSSMETYTQFCQIVPPSEMILLVTLRIKSPMGEGRMNLVYPFLVVEPLLPKLSAKFWYGGMRRGSEKERYAIADTARLIPTDAELLVRGPLLSLSGIAGIEKGQLIPLPVLDGRNCVLRAGGVDQLELSLVRKRGSKYELRNAGSAEPTGTGSRAGLDDRLAPAVAGIATDIAALRETLAGELGSLGSEIRKIKGEQETLADRLDFGDGEAAATDRGVAASPMGSLRDYPAQALLPFLANESAQLVALIVANLDDGLAAKILDGLPEDRQAAVVEKIASMHRVAPSVLETLENAFLNLLRDARKDDAQVGGIDKGVGILNISPRAVEKNVIESLERSKPELAEDIKRNMFVFEDIVLLDDEAIRAVVDRVDARDLLVAMKPVSAAIRERIFMLFDAEDAKKLREGYAKLGKMRLSESDAAGQRIVEAIRTLEGEGRITIVLPEAT